MIRIVIHFSIVKVAKHKKKFNQNKSIGSIALVVVSPLHSYNFANAKFELIFYSFIFSWIIILCWQNKTKIKSNHNYYIYTNNNRHLHNLCTLFVLSIFTFEYQSTFDVSFSFSIFIDIWIFVVGPFFKWSLII